MKLPHWVLLAHFLFIFNVFFDVKVQYLQLVLLVSIYIYKFRDETNCRTNKTISN